MLLLENCWFRQWKSSAFHVCTWLTATCARSPTTNEINQSRINYQIWAGHACGEASQCFLSLSLSFSPALPPLTRSFLMINANSNDSSSVSCVLRCSAFRSRSHYKRRTSTAEVNNSTHRLNTQSRPHQTLTIKMNPLPKTHCNVTWAVKCEL